MLGKNRLREKKRALYDSSDDWCLEQLSLQRQKGWRFQGPEGKGMEVNALGIVSFGDIDKNIVTD